MNFRIIDAQTLNDFVENSPNVHYMKTHMWAVFKHAMEHTNSTNLGFYEADTLVATAMVLQSSWMTHSYLYVPWGPCMDYSNLPLVSDVFTCLKQYADEKNVQFLRVDPNVIRFHKTIEGERIEDGFSNEGVTNQITSLGYLHKGYGYAYNGSWTNRFTLVIDLNRELPEILNGFAKPRKTELNRHSICGVQTRIGTQDDIPSLMEFEKQLCEQDGFAPHSKEFFLSLLNSFSKHAVLYVTEINLETMATGIQGELESKKYRKDPEARAAKEKELEKVNRLKQTYGSQLPIACGLFIRIGTWSWDLYTYNHKEFNFIKPVTNLHAFAIEDMKKNGVTNYDMCGFSGVTDRKDPYYGLYAFKRSFGPTFVEQIGEFDYVRKPQAMKRFRFEKLAVNHLKRKFWSIAYQKKAKQ